MKKLLLLTSLSLCAATSIQAQVVSTDLERGFRVIPASLTSNGKATLYAASDVYTEDVATFKVYDENFQLAKTINIDRIAFDTSSRTETAVVVPTGAKRSYSASASSVSWADDVDVSAITTADQFAEIVTEKTKNAGFTSYTYTGFVDFEGHLCCYAPDGYHASFFGEKWFGTLYPQDYYYSIVDGKIVYYQYSSHSYTYEYSTDGAVWTQEGEERPSLSGYTYDGFDLQDYDNSLGAYITTYLTQTLFNSDEAYEYVLPIFEPYESISYSTSYQATDEGVKVTRTVYKRIKNVGFKIVSDNGNTVATIKSSLKVEDFGEYGSFGLYDVYIIRGKCYLQAREYTSDKETYYLYELDGNTSEVKALGAVEAKPRMVSVNDGVIELQLNDADTDSEVVLTGMGGQLVGKSRIPSGQTSARLNARNLGRGIYNVSLQRDGQVLQSEKVLLK